MKIINGAPCGFYCFLTWHVLRNLRKWKEIEGENVNIDLPRGLNLYWDMIKGPNVWEYYFKQIDPKEGREDIISERDLPKLHLYEGKNIRETLGILYNKYIFYNEITQRIVDKSLTILNGHSILGVHIRKTDKYDEDPESYPIDNKDVLNVVNKALSEDNYNKIYLATDDQETYDLFLKEYGNLLITTSRIRGNGHISIHHHMKDQSGYIKGLDAILDMEALSRCKFLVRCTSNLSATSMVLNQTLMCYNLNSIFRGDRREEESFNIYAKEYKP
jgi:hypothetical protein